MYTLQRRGHSEKPEEFRLRAFEISRRMLHAGPHSCIGTQEKRRIEWLFPKVGYYYRRNFGKGIVNWARRRVWRAQGSLTMRTIISEEMQFALRRKDCILNNKRDAITVRDPIYSG